MSRVSVPSTYFQKRGFSKEVLTRYSAGDYYCKQSDLHARALIPVFDDNYKFVIGVTGRAIYDEQLPKWKHSASFPSCFSLYNFWSAREYIQKTGQAILVEGPLDVLKLEEYGIHNSVALFGGEFSVSKQLKLDNLGVREVVLLMDGDSAGRLHADKIEKECSNFYSIKRINLPDDKDPGSMTKGELLLILPN